MQSPNLSNISPDAAQASGVSPKLQTSMNNSNNEDMTDNMLLKNLDCRSDIEPLDNVFDDEEVENEEEMEEDDDDPEALADLEQRKDEIIEEFFAIAIQFKHEALEEVKQDCKLNKVPKDQEKKRIAEVTAAMDQKKKEGMKEVKQKLAMIIDNDSIPLSVKIERLRDTEQIRAFMLGYFNLQGGRDPQSEQ